TLVISHGLGEDPPTKWSREPTGIAVDPGAVPAGFAGPRIWTTDDVRQDLFEVDTGADGLVGTADDVRKKIIATDLFGSLDPEGVTYNATEGWLHIIDGASETVYTIDPGPNAKFEGAGSDDVITSFSCFDHGCRNPEGIAWNSATGRLAIISKTGKQVVTEFSTNGYHLRDIDIASVTSTLDKPAGATWAPGSGGGTSLWVTDRGVDDPDGFFDHDGNPATPEIPLIDGNVFEYTVPDVAAVPVLMNMPTDTLDFGDVGVGVPKMLPVTILNSGGAAMTGTVAVTDGTKGFTVPSGGAFALDPGEFVDIDIKFDPPMGSTPAIAFADTLSIVSTGGADSVALTGGGVAPIPDISVAPTSAAFGSVETGTQKNIPVKVTNVGSSPLSVASTTVTGGPGFSIDSGGGTFVLAPGASQDVVVKFIPAALGSVTGKLAIASDDPDTPTVDVPLSGTGAAGLIDISVPSSTDLGSVALGTRGEKTVRVTNSGTSPLTVTGLDVTGDSEFSLLLVGLPFTLTAGEFKDITVRFDPFTLGLYTGNLAVTSNDPDEGTVNVALKGTGAAPITCPTASTPFTDVSASSFAATDIKCIYGLKVTTGTTATTYSPGNLVTREQMASFMARVYAVLAGTACPTPPVPFTDVSGSFHLNDIKCIFGLGVTTGTSATTYSPGDFVSREQMGSFLARLYKASHPGVAGNLLP
ncbi:MAG: choice-of-anchor D domain-containing protein, partial [Acidimicrobiales bacterium]